jgi:Spy/CpxP family protein refolding chaperone
MRGCFKAALAFGMVAILAAPALAQGGRGFGGGMGGVTNLIANPGVQKELKLTTEQTEKVTALSTELREKMGDIRSKLEGLEGQEAMTKRAELMKPINEEATKKIKGFLKDEQFTRLTQIELQQRGAQALADKEIAKKLSITDEQATKVKSILDDERSEMQELRQSAGNDFASVMPKIQALRKESNTKVMALMSADQKKTWKEMTGEPFEVPPMQRRGGANR